MYIYHTCPAHSLPDDVLLIAHHAIRHSEQCATEKEMPFVQRMFNATAEGRNLFKPAERVNAYLRDLPEGILELTISEFRHSLNAERSYMNTVRKSFDAEGYSQHAHLR